MQEQCLTSILAERRPLLRDLRLVQSLGVPDWCIAAGYVRNAVWDALHQRPSSTPLHDVDVIYYDPDELSESYEKQLEQQLKLRFGGYNWSVKNQARMHLRNGDMPYSTVEDAMRRWPETATSIGITLTGDDLRIVAPHGLDDLFALRIRRSPLFADHSFFRTRVQDKGWLREWPRLQLIEDSKKN